ncbi:iron-sulfur cluster assembly scaffold protein [Qipengyuania vesicularis]|uniref:iron-sulfur cluster assembly scaffold protein n=1 Tax=Qipengyuania vesicularis TaxID=2867232 RepID=UPI001C881D6D|nr:iron-sulfur cluster assembly scaffold protein [Qipengyuania vesicularis]
MTDRPGGALYSPQLLALAVELAQYPFKPDAAYLGEAHSRSCGSSIELSCNANLHGLGLRVTACAVGQAAAAIFARHAVGRDSDAIGVALLQIEQWLAGAPDIPAWPDFGALAAAREYPGRHGAILLPWKAALDALSKQSVTG